MPATAAHKNPCVTERNKEAKIKRLQITARKQNTPSKNLKTLKSVTSNKPPQQQNRQYNHSKEPFDVVIFPCTNVLSYSQANNKTVQW